MKDSLYDRIEVAAITVGQRHRAVDEQRVLAMMESLNEIGLKTPISVRLLNDGEEVQLVAGLHRLEAARRLNWRDVDIRIEEGDNLDAELWEIDENLMRAELSPSERAAHLARRKAIYLEKHPETKQHVAGGKARQGTASANLAFAEDTAAKTGKSERAVQRDTARGEKIDAAVLAEVRGTDLDKGTVLDELAAIPREEQAARLNDIRQRRQSNKAEDNDLAEDAAEKVAALIAEHVPGEHWDGLKANLHATSAKAVARALTRLTGVAVFDRSRSGEAA